MEKFPASFFIKSRSKLKELLLPSSVVIISSKLQVPRNGDQFYPYRQSSDMYYLTGIQQENCTLVMFSEEGMAEFGEMLFIQERDKKATTWDGPGITIEEAQESSGIQNGRSSRYLEHDLRKIIPACKYVYFGTPAAGLMNAFPSNEHEIRESLNPALKHLEEHELSPLMTRIRMFKEQEEIEMIKEAIRITEEAFRSILTLIKPGIREYQVAAMMTHIFQMHGARDHAFDPIVASGRNALTLHYTGNADTCNAGELVLLDFGAEWRYYAGDISRTIPVNGTFSKRQKEVYSANLHVLQKAFELMRPGILLGEINEEVGKIWQEKHLELGLYKRADIEKQSETWPMWKQFYWHGTSHSIGLDVHDPFDRSMPLSPGMVLSCEPAIYIENEGIGVRLENDVLITETGPVNLPESIPIEIEEIEHLMHSK